MTIAGDILLLVSVQFVFAFGAIPIRPGLLHSFVETTTVEKAKSISVSLSEQGVSFLAHHGLTSIKSLSEPGMHELEASPQCCDEISFPSLASSRSS
jgi:hypothetical protein